MPVRNAAKQERVTDDAGTFFLNNWESIDRKLQSRIHKRTILSKGKQQKDKGLRWFLGLRWSWFSGKTSLIGIS